jgi:2-oxoglutarate dehydrogenase E2 component (dihydrolipoamide succinyltransferase)
MDEILIEVETDKVVLEVPAPAAGVLSEVVAADGATVIAEQVIARIDSEAQSGGGPSGCGAPAYRTGRRRAGRCSRSGKWQQGGHCDAGGLQDHGRQRPCAGFGPRDRARRSCHQGRRAGLAVRRPGSATRCRPRPARRPRVRPRH